MATTTYGQEAFAHYHVLQTESARDMPVVDIGYYRLGDARAYVDDMLKRILHRAKDVGTDQTFVCVEQILGDIRRDWSVQVIGVSAWRDLLKGHIIPRDSRYGPVNLDNTYYEIQRCRSIGCKPELLGEMTKNQVKYIEWYDRCMGFSEFDTVELDVSDIPEITLEDFKSAEDYSHTVNMATTAFAEATTDVVMHGNDVSLGHYY